MDIQILAGIWLAIFIVMMVIVRKIIDYFQRLEQRRLREWTHEE